jgi:RNA polymerase sigma-70 factor, ECF subfamily
MTTTDEQLDDSVARDEALVERARGGSGAAFAALVDRHREGAYAIASNMCATPRDVEDVLQQAFLSAWREVDSLPSGARFTTWLYRIAMNTALEHRQRHPRHPSLSLEAFLPAFDREGRPVVSQGRWSELDAGSPEPFEITGLLREALECIDDRVRAAFVLRDLVQLLPEEAAAILQTSPQAVRLDAHRARLMLRGFILSQG